VQDEDSIEPIFKKGGRWLSLFMLKPVEMMTRLHLATMRYFARVKQWGLKRQLTSLSKKQAVQRAKLASGALSVVADKGVGALVETKAKHNSSEQLKRRFAENSKPFPVRATCSRAAWEEPLETVPNANLLH